MKKQPSKKANKNCKYIDKANKKTDAARKITSVNIAVLAIAAAAIAVYIIVAPGSEYSQIEQRRSKEFPKFSIAALLKGDFTTRLSEYYVDTVPLRDNFKKIAGRFTALKGVKGKHGSVIIDTGALSDNTPEATFDIENIVVPPARTPRPDNSALIPDTSENPSSTTSSTFSPDRPLHTSTPEQTDSGSSVQKTTAPTPPGQTLTSTGTYESNVGRPPTPTPAESIDGTPAYSVNGLLLTGDRIMELFGGRKDIAARYALNISAYKQSWGSSVNVYSMVIPVASGYYCPESISSSRKEMIEIIDLTESLTGDDVIDIHVFDVLDAHKSEYIYLRTDHHWSLLGAYYAWREFAAAAGVEAYDLNSSAYETKSKTNYLGSLFGLSESNPALQNNPDIYYYYKPTNDYTVKDIFPDGTESLYTNMYHEEFTSSYYGMLIGVDSKISEIKTDIKNGRIAVLIKDSFGKALAPFMTTVFEEIYIVDPRYFEGDLIQYVADKNATDVIFANCAFQISSSFPEGNTYVDRLEKLRS